MKALYARKPFDFQIREFDPKKPQFNQVLVKVRASGVCGTDLHFARDWGPEYAPLGHEIAAEVVEVGEGDIPYKPGDKVIVEDVAMCGICDSCKSGEPYRFGNMHNLEDQPGMAEMMTVNYHLLDRFDDIPWVEATLVEPMAVAYNTVLNANIKLGGTVVVVGPGPIGILCTKLAKMRGAGKVIIVGKTKKEIREKPRLKIGIELGADYIVQAKEEDAVKSVRDIFPKGADSVIVTSPPKTISTAVEFVRFGGTLSFIGINLGGQSSVELDINELIFNKISLIPTFAEPAQNFHDTINILRNKLIDTSKLITTIFSFNDARDIFMASDSGEKPIIKAVLVT